MGTYVYKIRSKTLPVQGALFGQVHQFRFSRTHDGGSRRSQARSGAPLCFVTRDFDSTSPEGCTVYLGSPEDALWYDDTPIPGTPIGTLRRDDDGALVLIAFEDEIPELMTQLRELWVKGGGDLDNLPVGIRYAAHKIRDLYIERHGREERGFGFYYGTCNHELVWVYLHEEDVPRDDWDIVERALYVDAMMRAR